MGEVVLTLVCSPASEEKLWDFLLLAEEAGVFTSVRVSGHGVHPSRLDIAEQVEGRTRELVFTLILTDDGAQSLVTRLREELRGLALRYWITPVIQSGEIE